MSEARGLGVDKVTIRRWLDRRLIRPSTATSANADHEPATQALATRVSPKDFPPIIEQYLRPTAAEPVDEATARPQALRRLR